MPEGSVEYHINIIHRQLSHLQTSPCRADRHSAAGAHDCALPLRRMRPNGGTTTQWHFSEGKTLPRKKTSGCQILACLAGMLEPETFLCSTLGKVWQLTLLTHLQNVKILLSCLTSWPLGQCVNSLLCTVKTYNSSVGRDLIWQQLYWNQTNKNPPVTFSFYWWEGWG